MFRLVKFSYDFTLLVDHETVLVLEQVQVRVRDHSSPLEVLRFGLGTFVDLTRSMCHMCTKYVAEDAASKSK